MRNSFSLCITLLITGIAVYDASAQTGNFGIGTPAPGSKLTVEGSLGLAYKTVATNYAMTASDYYVAWSGAAAGTITLPAAISGSGNYKGRVYAIKNTSTGQTLSIAANGAELINQNGGAGLANIAITSGQSLTLISTGATSGNTWQVVSLGSSTAAATGTSINTPNTLVLRDAFGNFSAGTVTAASLKMTTGATDGYILKSNATGDASWAINGWTISGNNQYNALSGNVGIGTPSPGDKLDVIGNARIRSNDNNSLVYVAVGRTATDVQLAVAGGNGEFAPNAVAGDATLRTESVSAKLFLANSTGSGMVISSNNVGIGTSTPATKLDVAGTTKTTNLQMTSGATNGYVLKSDASGNASWGNVSSVETDPKIGSNTTNYLPKWNGSTLSTGSVYDNGGNIGIGNNNPGARLDVTGTTKTTNLQMTNGATDGYVLKSDAAGNASWANVSFAETDPKIGANTTNYLPKWNGSTLSTGSVYDNGGKIGIGTSNPDSKLHIAGTGQQYITLQSTGTTKWGIMTSPTGSGLTTTFYIVDLLSLTSRFGIDANGNIGIGSVAPLSHLHIFGSGEQAISLQTDGGRRWAMQSNLTDWDLNTTFQIVDRSAGASRLGIDNNGNVGIGTVTPASKLDVAGSIKAAGLQISTGAADGYMLKSDANGVASWTDAISTTSLQITGGAINGYLLTTDAGGNASWASPGSFSVGSWTTSGNNQYSAISGNVGIGAPVPATRLHIAGAGDQEISIESTTTGTFNGHRWTLQSNTPAVGLNASFQIIDRTAGSSRFSIDQSGNVGIGTTNPATRLEVNGALKASSLQTSGGISVGAVTAGLLRLTNAGTIVTLTDAHYCVVATAISCSVGLPVPSTCAGRVYVLFNTSAGSLFTNLAAPNETIEANTKVQVISDGVSWLQLN